MLVRECITHFPFTQNVLSTVKPGFIIGSPEQGVANTDDLLWRVVAGAARIGAYPIETSEHWVFVSDVDAVTNTIVNQLTLQSPDAFVDVNTGVSVPTFWDVIQSGLESPIQPVSWEQWKSMAHDDLTREGQAHPLWSVQQFLGQLGVSRQPSHVMEDWGNERMKAALTSNVAYLQDVHFIGQRLEDTAGDSSKVFKRSRRVM
nr:nonribosomal peptide synthetase fmpe [Quercus suber]